MKTHRPPAVTPPIQNTWPPSVWQKDEPVMGEPVFTRIKDSPFLEGERQVTHNPPVEGAFVRPGACGRNYRVLVSGRPPDDRACTINAGHSGMCSDGFHVWPGPDFDMRNVPPPGTQAKCPNTVSVTFLNGNGGKVWARCGLEDFHAGRCAINKSLLSEDQLARIAREATITATTTPSPVKLTRGCDTPCCGRERIPASIYCVECHTKAFAPPTARWGGQEYELFDVGNHGRKPRPQTRFGQGDLIRGITPVPIETRIATAKQLSTMEADRAGANAEDRAAKVSTRLVNDGARHRMECMA